MSAGTGIDIEATVEPAGAVNIPAVINRKRLTVVVKLGAESANPDRIYLSCKGRTEKQEWQKYFKNHNSAGVKIMPAERCFLLLLGSTL
jgi:hypothetical protein